METRGCCRESQKKPWAEGASQAAHSVCLFGLGDRPCCPKLVSPKNLLERHSCQGIKLVQWCWLCALSHTEMAEGKGSFAISISQLYLTGRSVACLHINALCPSLGSYICFRVLKEEVWTFLTHVYNTVPTVSEDLLLALLHSCLLQVLHEIHFWPRLTGIYMIQFVWNL